VKKKHRDIIVHGKVYGWTVTNYGSWNKLRIWENKKVVKEVKVTSLFLITPAVVADCIENPEQVEKYNVIAEDCPFCGGEVTHHPKGEWQRQYFVCYHSENCWLNDGKPPYNFTLIPINALNQWNERH